jgi:uncharacterized membrane protein YeiH
MSATGAPVVALEVVGTLGFAVSSAMAAARRRMDIFGVAALAVIVAIGGGTLRDLLLSEPVAWLRTWWPTAVAAAAALATIPVALRLGPDVDSRRIVLLADALGLAVFSTLGCLKALDAGTSAEIAVIIGTITGITGGILRDVLTGKTPAVFAGQVYALAALAGTSLYALLVRSDVNSNVAWWLGVVSIFSLRGLAVQRHWSIGTINPPKAHGEASGVHCATCTATRPAQPSSRVPILVSSQTRSPVERAPTAPLTRAASRTENNERSN